MKSIMISIQPQCVEKILNDEKTIEIRKTRPKCELPCKVYIYCTMGKNTIVYVERKGEKDWYGNIAKNTMIVTRPKYDYMNYTNETLGKVIAEFMLNKVDTLERDLNDWLPKNRYDVSNDLLKDINSNQEQLWNYGQGKTLYAWHIDNLKIYDKPKELSEFSHFIPNNKCPTKQCGTNCEDCPNYDEEHETCLALYYAHRVIKRPPQSWCYVEELENE